MQVELAFTSGDDKNKERYSSFYGMVVGENDIIIGNIKSQMEQCRGE
jgi:hypothetical protein